MIASTNKCCDDSLSSEYTRESKVALLKRLRPNSIAIAVMLGTASWRWTPLVVEVGTIERRAP